MRVGAKRSRESEATEKGTSNRSLSGFESERATRKPTILQEQFPKKPPPVLVSHNFQTKPFTTKRVGTRDLYCIGVEQGENPRSECGSVKRRILIVHVSAVA